MSVQSEAEWGQGSETAKTEIEQKSRDLGKEAANSMALSKREMFAAMAMQGLLHGYMTAEGWKNADYGKEAVKIADALLIALAESEVQP